MKSVSQFEGQLLRMLQAILQHGPRERVVSLLKQQTGRPACLSRAAVELVADTLSKGTVLLLARTGWRQDRHLRQGQIRSGRLWQRTLPQELGLTFSRHALDMLLTLMDHAAVMFPREKAAQDNVAPVPDRLPWNPPMNELAMGDRLLCYWTLEALRGTELAKTLCRHPYFIQDGLCRLAFPDEFTETEAGPDFSPWTNGLGSCLLEALQIPLAEHWLRLERGKEQITSAQRMTGIGVSQERVLHSFAAALTGSERWDLARFLLRVLAMLFGDQPSVWKWTGGLNLGKVRLAERQSAYRAALALVRFADVLGGWEQRARTVGYFDEGYAACQLWKADWEASEGAEMWRLARQLGQEVPGAF